MTAPYFYMVDAAMKPYYWQQATRLCSTLLVICSGLLYGEPVDEDRAVEKTADLYKKDTNYTVDGSSSDEDPALKNALSYPWFPPFFPFDIWSMQPLIVSPFVLHTFSNSFSRKLKSLMAQKEGSHLTPPKARPIPPISGSNPKLDRLQLTGSQVIMVYPLLSQEEEASANPALIERHDIKYIGHPCCYCAKLFNAEDSVIYTSCKHLIHEQCLIDLDSCPICNEDLRALVTLVSARNEITSSAKLSWAEIFIASDYLVSCLPEATTPQQGWLNKVNEVEIRQTLSKLMIDSSLKKTPRKEKKSVAYIQLEAQLQLIVWNLCAGELPEQFPDLSGLSAQELKQISDHFRPIFLELWIYAIVDRQWARQLADIIANGRCLEVCAGRGWLAKALRTHGVSIIAIDLAPDDPVTDVEVQDAVNAIHHHPEIDYLIISWPPLNSPVAARCVRAIKTHTTIIYIGEWRDGCCANDDFFESVEIIQTLRIPSWFGFTDKIYILKKK